MINPLPHRLRWAAPDDPAAISVLDLSLPSNLVRDFASTATPFALRPRQVFHELPSVKGSSRGPIILPTRNSQGARRVCGMLMHHSVPKQSRPKDKVRLPETGPRQLCNTSYRGNLVPRLRETGSRLEKVIFSRLNKTGAEWQEADESSTSLEDWTSQDSESVSLV